EYITIFRAPIPSDQFHESSQAKGLFKKAHCLTRPARARQDVLFLWQGRRVLGARSVHRVREGERRKERQACEREADKGPRTPLADFFKRLII
ncbi:MAG: hypothetical protein V3U07_06545, partial [Nitrospirales bacterium]